VGPLSVRQKEEGCRKVSRKGGKRSPESQERGGEGFTPTGVQGQNGFMSAGTRDKQSQGVRGGGDRPNQFLRGERRENRVPSSRGKRSEWEKYCNVFYGEGKENEEKKSSCSERKRKKTRGKRRKKKTKRHLKCQLLVGLPMKVRRERGTGETGEAGKMGGGKRRKTPIGTSFADGKRGN